MYCITMNIPAAYVTMYMFLCGFYNLPHYTLDSLTFTSTIFDKNTSVFVYHDNELLTNFILEQ
jgi:hypothetical protein